MNTGMIPLRYASALLSFAEQHGQEKQIYDSALRLVANMRRHNRIQPMLENPAVAAANKIEIVRKATENADNKVLNGFIELVFKNKRETYLLRIMLRYADLYRKKNNIYSGKLITASTINDTTAKRLIRIIEDRNNGVLEMEQVVEPALIGGFILEMNNLRLDASVRNQLLMMKNELTAK